MKILYVHNNYASNNSGEEHASQALAILLTQKGHEVEWFRKSSDVIGDSISAKIVAFFSGIYNPKAVRELKQKIKTFKPDVIQVQNVYPFISPAILKMINKLDIPVVMRCPNYRLFCPSGLHLDAQSNICEKCLSGLKEINCITKNCERNLLKSVGYAVRNFVARTMWKLNTNMDAYIVQTEFQKQKFLSNGIPKEKLFVVSGVTPRMKEVKNDENSVYVSFVGRVSLEKGIVEFLQAAKELPHIKFAVVGALDPSLNYLKESINSENVMWTGFLSGKDFDDMYNKTKIVVVPSKWYEGFPNVITRAMICSKPVITTKLGAMQSIIDHEDNGLLVNPGDASDLKLAVESLYNEDEKCKNMGRKGKLKAQKLYSDAMIYDSLISTYNYAVNKKDTNVV